MLGLHHENISCCVLFRPPDPTSRHELLIWSQRTRLKRQIAVIAYMQSLASAGTILSKLGVVQTSAETPIFPLKASQTINNKRQNVQNENERMGGKEKEERKHLR